tara:strand:- start:139 stop:261 length:123 start_codon:yes stop_codon:yes gene_type:complete
MSKCFENVHAELEPNSIINMELKSSDEINPILSKGFEPLF